MASEVELVYSVRICEPPKVSKLDSTVKAINDFVARLKRAAPRCTLRQQIPPWLPGLSRVANQAARVRPSFPCRNLSFLFFIQFKESASCPPHLEIRRLDRR
jgi:hypothetical protein